MFRLQSDAELMHESHTDYGIKLVDIHHINIMGPNNTIVSYWP